MRKKFVLSVMITLALSSCRKDELPVPKLAPSDVTTTIVDTGTDYQKVIYFDLGTNQNVGESNKLNWDLRISCDPNNNYILLNAGRVMMASKVSASTFEQITNTNNFNISKLVDHPSLQLDSIALREGSLFIIDRGINFSGSNLGYFKMEILEHTSTYFKGRFANIDGSNDQIITIVKDPTYNFMYLKWDQTNAISFPIIEPPKAAWDIVFTQFTEIFYEPEFMPYLVTGVLTNHHNTLATRYTDLPFDQINYEFAEQAILSDNRDVIGYDWKSYQFNTSTYVVNSNLSYIIKDQEGVYYKLRFIDFYNLQGQKGAPNFEFQQLVP